jgi:hypothetical protein
MKTYAITRVEKKIFAAGKIFATRTRLEYSAAKKSFGPGPASVSR